MGGLLGEMEKWEEGSWKALEGLSWSAFLIKLHGVIFRTLYLYAFQNVLFSSEVCLHKARATPPSLGFPKVMDFLDVLGDMEIMGLGYIL